MFLILLNLSCVFSLEEKICTFPPGSITCKVWNYTNMDCSWRELVCIPPLYHKASMESLDLSRNRLETLPQSTFMGFTRLHTLDLSSNSISYLIDNLFSGLNNLLILNLSSNGIKSIENSAFSGLSRLKTLDLSWNEDFDISNGSPFQDLPSLQTLDLYSSDHSLAITNSTFTGLNSLQLLSVNVNSTTGTPFIHLPALKHMELELGTGRTAIMGKFFTGLVDLEYINVTCEYPYCFGTIDICLLISLQSLKITGGWFIMNKSCLQLIPLKMLDVTAGAPPFEMLNNLRSLTWKTFYISVDTLNSLDSPLHNLSLKSYSYSHLALTSTTFESWPKWKESLQVFKIIWGGINLEGSPFKWFPKLQVLCLSGVSVLYSVEANITFDGLEGLQELHLPSVFYCPFCDYDIYIALPIFGKYNSLKLLNLAHNHLDRSLDFICSVLSLEKVDLSYNRISGSFQFKCTMPNLKILEIESLTPDSRTPYLDNICIKAPNLKILKAKSSGCVIINEFACPNLAAVYLSKSQISFCNTSIIMVPYLEELYLNEIIYNSGSLTNIKILSNFRMPKLRILDLSSNQISVIDREDVLVLSNVTYLNLRNNTLISLTGLQHLSKIQVLLLGGNEISIGPKLLLRNKLNTLDMCNNPIQCDCSVEAFKTWILTNKVGFLVSSCLAFDPNGNQYKCSSPYGRVGLSVTDIDLDCEPPLVKIISISITCVVFVTFTTILIVRYYWHIRYRLFLLFNRRAYKSYLVNDDADNNDDENGMPIYDAYVTYHREDEDWVDGELLPNIEEGEEPFRLCLKTRDIRAGRPVFGEMSLRIQRSRKILVILSPRFVNDNWCYFELNMAHHRVLEENSKVLIFIMLEKIPDNKLTLLLRQLFCRAQCFKFPADGYGQHLFWQRIREELKRPVPRDRRFNI